MRTFRLIRHNGDVVAEGVEFSDGKVVFHWLSESSTIAIYPEGMKAVLRINQRYGDTEIVLMD